MKIKEQTRQLAAGCSKHRFEFADKADVVEEIFEEYKYTIQQFFHYKRHPIKVFTPDWMPFF